MNSIKKKNKLYKKAVNSGIASEFQKYKQFNNTLTHFKRKLNSITTRSSCLKTPVLQEKLGKQSIK